MNEHDLNTIAATILNELQSYDRFSLWVNANYQIHLAPNDDKKCVEVKVIEVDMALAQENLARAVKEKLKERENKIQIAGADVLEKLNKL